MKNVREEITNTLVDAIKAGTAPWTRPWRGREAPKNISDASILASIL